MTTDRHLVILALEDRRYALPLAAVERVVRLVEITPLPEARRTVLGVINVQGRIVPALSLRRCLNLPERELRLSDQLIIARIEGQMVALVADAVLGVYEPPDRAIASAPAILPDLEQVDGVLKVEDLLVPLINLAALFPPNVAGALPLLEATAGAAETRP